MNKSENTYRCIRFETPEWIPLGFHINPSCWHHYRQEDLKRLMTEHPMIWPDYEYSDEPFEPIIPLDARKDEPYRDPWGCMRETTDDGIAGTVHEHPLADWSALDTFQPPDPETTTGRFPVDWRQIEERIKTALDEGPLAGGGLPHGHTFLQLIDLRGYENVILDMADDEPRLHTLLGMLREFNLTVVQRFIDLGSTLLSFPEDLGMQRGPMLSPAHFRKYIKPCYEAYMTPARQAGCLIHMHSDGDIRDLLDDLFDSGVDVINLQDLVNGVDWIAANLGGKHCIDLDIDRQEITVHGTVEQIDAHIRHCVEAIGRPEGGLMLKYGMYPGTPIENAFAVADAMETYATYYN